jgi:hypothetical protein
MVLLPLLVATAFNLPGQPFNWPVECGDPCVINFSPGGSVWDFRLEGYALAAQKRKIIVNGPCFSACTLLIDVAESTRPGSVCITDNAVLGYHEGFYQESGATVYITLSFQTKGLQKHLDETGGIPANKDDMRYVFPIEASKFYRMCR